MEGDSKAVGIGLGVGLGGFAIVVRIYSKEKNNCLIDFYLGYDYLYSLACFLWIVSIDNPIMIFFILI